MNAEYIVVNENTLGYFQTPACKAKGYYGVLSQAILIGGKHWMNGPCFLSSLDTSRPATLQDFNSFNLTPPPCYRK
jgi:hypothetical protein